MGFTWQAGAMSFCVRVERDLFKARNTGEVLAAHHRAGGHHEGGSAQPALTCGVP